MVATTDIQSAEQPLDLQFTEDELIAALQQALDWPTIAAVDTAAVATILNENQQTVRNRLKATRDDEAVPVGGTRPGEQSGWVWWLTDADYY